MTRTEPCKWTVRLSGVTVSGGETEECGCAQQTPRPPCPPPARAPPAGSHTGLQARCVEKKSHMHLALSKTGCLICMSLTTRRSNLLSQGLTAIFSPLSVRPLDTNVFGQPSRSAVAPVPPADFLHFHLSLVRHRETVTFDSFYS